MSLTARKFYVTYPVANMFCNRSSPVQFTRSRAIVLRAEVARGRASWTIHRIGDLNGY